MDRNTIVIPEPLIPKDMSICYSHLPSLYMESLEASGRLGSATLPLEGCNCGIFIAACACPCPCPCIVGDINAKSDCNFGLAVGSASWSNHKEFITRTTRSDALLRGLRTRRFIYALNSVLFSTTREFEWISTKKSVFFFKSTNTTRFYRVFT